MGGIKGWNEIGKQNKHFDKILDFYVCLQIDNLQVVVLVITSLIVTFQEIHWLCMPKLENVLNKIWYSFKAWHVSNKSVTFGE